MKKRALLLVVVVGVPTLTIGMAATPAVAIGAGIPHYTGPAPGEVTCSVKATITFSPAFGKPGSGAKPAKLKGALRGCELEQSTGTTIASGKLSGSFAMSPYACSIGCGGTDASASLSVAWKGDYSAPEGQGGGKAHFTKSAVIDTGSSAFTGPSGDIGFYVPGVDHSSTVTGSFASNGSYLNLVTTDTPTQFAAAEGSRAGLKKLAVTGTLTFRDITAYVTNKSDNTVTPIDTSTNTPGPVIDVGKSPQGIAISPDGATAYVANDGDNTVTPVNTFTNKPGTVIDVGDGPDAIAFSPNGATAYVGNANSNTVTPIATSTNTPRSVIDVGEDPTAIAITPNGAAAYVTDTDSNTVTPIDTSTNTPGTAIDVATDPVDIAITPNGATAYAVSFDQDSPSDGGVTPIATSTNTPGSLISVELNPDAIAITPNGTTAFVVSFQGSDVTPISTSTNAPGRAIDVGSFPYGIAITPNGATAYVANEGPNTVTPISTSTDTPGLAITVGSTPWAIAIG